MEIFLVNAPQIPPRKVCEGGTIWAHREEEDLRARHEVPQGLVRHDARPHRLAVVPLVEIVSKV